MKTKKTVQLTEVQMTAWAPARTIRDFPQYHSDGMGYKMLLLAIPGRNSAVLGWYLGGRIQEFRMDGSPSKWNPTHWMPLPKLPS